MVKRNKEIIVCSMLSFYFLLFLISSKEFFYRVSDVCIALETLFYMIYIYQDVKTFRPLAKACYAGIFSLVSINVITAFPIMFIKFYNQDKSAEEIDNIIMLSRSKYLNDYSLPFIAVSVVLVCTLLYKRLNNDR